MRLKPELLALALFAILAQSADAALIITVAPSSNGVAQVLITSSASDDLGEFTAVYDIKPDSSNAISPLASLEFVSPSDYTTDPTLNDTNYVYNASNPNVPGGASFDYDTSTVFGGASDPTSSGYNTHFSGSDIYFGSAASNAATLVSGTSYGLSNLVLQYIAPGTTNAAGDVFDITLDLANSSFKDGSNHRLSISSPNGANPIIAIVTVLSATDITVSMPVASVPEPSSLALAGLGSIGLALAVRPKRVSAATISIGQLMHRS